MRSHAKASSAGSNSGPEQLRRAAVPAAVALCVLLAALLLSTFASAAETRLPAIATIEPFSEPGAVAVDQGTNDVYVADYATDKVSKFDENGAPSNFSALGSNEIGGFSMFSEEALQELAVDSTSHNLYVADYGHGAIQAFKQNGEPYEFTAGPGAGTNKLPGFTELCGVAVDSNGDIYMGDIRRGVHVYAPNGEALTSFETEEEACNVAVDSAGEVYSARYPYGTAGVEKFTPSQFPVTSSTTYTSAGLLTSAATFAIAVDPANDQVYVDLGNKVRVYDSSGALSYEFATEITGSEGVAVDDSNGKAYAADVGNEAVQVYGPAIVTPDAITEAPTAVSTTSALLHGKAGAAGGSSTTCEFQYTTEAKFKSEGFTGASTVPCSPAGPFTGETQTAVSGEATGLTPGVFYRFRLVSTSSGGTGFGEALTFHTKTTPPIESESVESVGSDNADLSAVIKPGFETATYKVEFGTTTAYGQTSPTATIGFEEDNSPHTVSVHVAGLVPGTAYHFRFVATNGTGTTNGADTSFATYPVQQAFAPCSNHQFRTGFGEALPDCRAYEQASPTDKNGGNVKGKEGAMEASSNGDRVIFYILAGLPTSGGSSNLSTPYMASRGPGGWSTDGTLPATDPGVEPTPMGWSEDLSQSFLFASNTISRRDSASAAYQPELTPAGPLGEPGAVGFAADPQHLVFQTPGFGGSELVPGVPAGPRNLYDLDHGKLTYVGRIPAGSATSCDDEAGPACIVSPTGSFAGVDGNIGLQKLKTQGTISRDGSKVFFSTPGEREIYVREDGERTTWISASQRATPDPSGTQPATLQAVTPDGSKAFFTSSSELTNDAFTGLPASIATANLDGTGVDRSLIPTAASAVAADGSHVYWVNTGANKIGRANLDGTGVEESFITGADNPRGIAVDGSHLYWTNAGTGTIGRANLDGTGVEQSFITGASNPRGIAVDSSHVYWTNAGTSQIGMANIDGTSPNQSLIATDSGPMGVAVDSSYVYWATESGIGRANLDGTSPNPSFVSSQNAQEPRGLAVDDSHIYWTSFRTGNGGTILRANLDGSGVEQSFIPGVYHSEGLALQGGHVFWTHASSADLGNDLYAYDSGSGQLTDLSADSSVTNAKGADVVGVLGASADGSYVYFAANGVLAPGASAGDCLYTTNIRSLTCNLYVAHDGAVTFVAPLRNGAGSSGGGNASIDENNWGPGFSSLGGGNIARVADDGTLLFGSRNRLTGYDNVEPGEHCGGEFTPEPCVYPEFYRYVPTTEKLDCVSCNPAGLPPRGEPMLVSEHGNAFFSGAITSARIFTRNLSANGKRVFFETPDALLPTDTNGNSGCPKIGGNQNPSCLDVYEWEAKGEGSCESESQNGGCLYLISSGRSPDPSFFLDASKNGNDVFFFTPQQLVPGDKDQLEDVYDASAGGGLASQHALTPATCDSTACTANPPPPPPQSLSSASFSGPGNAKPTPSKSRCPKGKRKVRSAGKSRCVARHAKKKHHKRAQHQQANTNRGGSK